VQIGIGFGIALGIAANFGSLFLQLGSTLLAELWANSLAEVTLADWASPIDKRKDESGNHHRTTN